MVEMAEKHGAPHLPRPQSTATGGFQPPRGESRRAARLLSGESASIGDVFSRVVADADLLQAIAQRVSRKAEQARSLAFVAVGAAVRRTDDFVFPLVERFAFRQQRRGGTRSPRRRGIEANVVHLDHWAARQRGG